MPVLKGSLLLFLTRLGALVWGEVGDFGPCLSFFYMETPPTGVEGAGYQPICQRHVNQYHFASLFQRPRRVPFYSAYVLTAGGGKRPSNRWMYEPQLAFRGAGPNMRNFPKHGTVDQNVVESQAVLQDYTNSSYSKGHLNPSLHHNCPEDRRATFTLTNVVPQKVGSNSGPWARLESEVRDLMANYCVGPVYVITGALPYLSERWMANRVAVPEYMWSAYCCPSYKSSLPAHLKPYFPSYAAVGRNDAQSGGEIVPVDPKAKPSVRGYDVRRMSLDTLETVLRLRLKFHISLFQNQCL
ncbi:hypothetical protein DPEC_G00027530 [Dallia pectoralis]|uniref:Uncharacterized protein n=1 Tax=Dallia pectoralis TaxID=75939 RepID=A0ACC2HHW0_DALPE|nr:hypothetical protein DPEC_G00027530 [Dallia pectoralis]